MDYNALYIRFNEEFWRFFLGSDKATGRKGITFEWWVKKRSALARKAMYRYLEQNGAPNENPYFWVRRFPEPAEPTNYFGKELARGVNYFTAIHNGKKGLYTAADIEFYEMQNAQPFNI